MYVGPGHAFPKLFTDQKGLSRPRGLQKDQAACKLQVAPPLLSTPFGKPRFMPPLHTSDSANLKFRVLVDM